MCACVPPSHVLSLMCLVPSLPLFAAAAAGAVGSMRACVCPRARCRHAPPTGGRLVGWSVGRAPSLPFYVVPLAGTPVCCCVGQPATSCRGLCRPRCTGTHPVGRRACYHPLPARARPGALSYLPCALAALRPCLRATPDNPPRAARVRAVRVTARVCDPVRLRVCQPATPTRRGGRLHCVHARSAVRLFAWLVLRTIILSL